MGAGRTAQSSHSRLFGFCTVDYWAEHCYMIYSIDRSIDLVGSYESSGCKDRTPYTELYYKEAVKNQSPVQFIFIPNQKQLTTAKAMASDGEQFVGKFNLVSQENLDEYLKAIGNILID
jgi:hypothetical protein